MHVAHAGRKRQWIRRAVPSTPGNRHHLCALPRLVELADEFDAVHIGEFQIHDNGIRRCFARVLKPGVAFMGLDHLEAGGNQHAFQAPANGHVAVYQ